MKIGERFHGDVAVLKISGNLMSGPESGELHQAVKTIIEKGYLKVVIDLSDVKWMNSSGIGALMASYSSLAAKNGKIRLVGVTEKIESLLVVTRLIKTFDTFKMVEDALVGF